MEAVKNLEAAANALLSPPSSVQQLLYLLYELEKCLMVMAQSPPQCLKNAIPLAINALTSSQLVHNEDEDVKVSVALCITEIMRITAPDPPCSDEQMKELFTMIVPAFDNISDISSSSYLRRVSILTTFGKLRLCYVMVDLKCNSLVHQMFKHFLGNIRENHPDSVFMYMGFIMIMFLEEIDEIPLEILSTLLGCVRTRNQNILPIGRKLAERVMENSYLKLAPYMCQAVHYTGYPLEDYGRIVAYLCELQSRLPDHEHHQAVASQDSTPANRLALDDKADLSMLRWIVKKKRGSGKISKHDFKKRKRLSTKTSLSPNEGKHFVGNLTRSRKGVQRSKNHKLCEGDYDPLKKKKRKPKGASL